MPERQFYRPMISNPDLSKFKSAYTSHANNNANDSNRPSVLAKIHSANKKRIKQNNEKTMPKHSEARQLKKNKKKKCNGNRKKIKQHKQKAMQKLQTSVHRTDPGNVGYVHTYQA